ncbi:MAG TPA: 6-phosphogluconolactonase, partial [Polyangiaceae bacterium]
WILILYQLTPSFRHRNHNNANATRMGERVLDTLVLAEAEGVAVSAAEFIAKQARSAVSSRGQFTLAVSGGSTPWRMLAHLAEQALPWDQTRIFQVDERAAKEGDASRNLTHLTASLQRRWGQLQGRIHPIPIVESDLQAGAAAYSATLNRYAGNPACLDLVHLGLGSDGHTASLVTGDPAIHVQDRDVALTEEYRGQRRITLTLPALNRARQILWLVVGRDKRQAVQQLLAGDESIAAGRVHAQHATLIADREALDPASLSE